MADIIVADRLTDGNQKLLQGVQGLQVGWSISQAGLIAFDMPVKDMKAAGVNPATLLGKWLHYTHPYAGGWGGHVTNVLPREGVVSVSGESWVSLLRGILLEGNGSTQSSYMTSIRNIINTHTGFTGIDSFSTDWSIAVGTSLPGVVADLFEEPGIDLYDVVLPAILDYIESTAESYPAAAQLLPYGYTCRASDRRFQFKTGFGVDRSATVKVSEGRDVPSASWGDDLQDVINVVWLSAFITQPGKARTCKTKYKKGKKKGQCKVYNPATPDREIPANATGKNASSFAKFGQRSIRIEQPFNYRTRENLQDHAQKLANSYSTNRQSCTVNLSNDLITVGTTPTRIFSAFREFDVISVELPYEGVKGKMAVRHRALDVDSGIMTVSGEAELA